MNQKAKCLAIVVLIWLDHKKICKLLPMLDVWRQRESLERRRGRMHLYPQHPTEWKNEEILAIQNKTRNTILYKSLIPPVSSCHKHTLPSTQNSQRIGVSWENRSYWTQHKIIFNYSTSNLMFNFSILELFLLFSSSSSHF